MREKLPAKERVEILTNRIVAIQGGAGDFPSDFHRQQAIWNAEGSLAGAYAELQRESKR